ncbi:MAG: FtsX-like permease family protein [Bacteroidota bacterium]|nr:FtsX-like permease family protein [Bacteroidota bacterium]
MNISFFISNKLLITKESNNSYTRPIIRISIFAIAISVAFMLLSIMIVMGFKNQVANKVIGFNSHIQITSFGDNQSYGNDPIDKKQNFYSSITQEEGIEHIQVFATKAGIIKTEDEIHGVVLKGVGDDFHKDFFKENLVEGVVPIFNDSLVSNNILISQRIVKLLNLKLGQDIFVYFIQDPPRVRKFKISGIYRTGFSDFDDIILLGDIRHVQNLNSWGHDRVGGFEIMLSNLDDIDRHTQIVYNQLDYNLICKNIKELYPQIFDWLDLQNLNIQVILFLMIVVGVMNMITALLIMILEKTQLIGILKALGANNWVVRKVFVYNALYLIIYGLMLGNIFGLSLGYLQKTFNLIKLDPNIYYMDTVPINFDFSSIILLNLGVFIICWLVLLIPSIIITKMKPIQSIRFE